MTQKAIGPNFPNELAANALLGLPFSWSSDGTLTFGSTMTPTQISAVQAVYAAHNPATVSPQATFNAAMVAGLAITSTGTPAVNGTYGCLAQYTAPPGNDQFFLTALQAAITAGKPVPTTYYDSKGSHSVPNATLMGEICAAVFSYVSAWQQWLMAGGTGTQPTQSSFSTIA